MLRSRHGGALALAAMLGVLASCSDVAAPTALVPDAEPSLSTSYGAVLLECPISTETTGTATIGSKGGTLRVDGHRLDVPQNAVRGPTAFTGRVRAGNYLEVDFSPASGGGFTFERPVTITLDYSRCTRSNIEKRDLRIYYIDPVTKEILAELGGTDDKAARTVTATTGHLSDYAVGVPF